MVLRMRAEGGKAQRSGSRLQSCVKASTASAPAEGYQLKKRRHFAFPGVANKSICGIPRREITTRKALSDSSHSVSGLCSREARSASVLSADLMKEANTHKFRSFHQVYNRRASAWRSRPWIPPILLIYVRAVVLSIRSKIVTSWRSPAKACKALPAARSSNTLMWKVTSSPCQAPLTDCPRQCAPQPVEDASKKIPLAKGIRRIGLYPVGTCDAHQWRLVPTSEERCQKASKSWSEKQSARKRANRGTSDAVWHTGSRNSKSSVNLWGQRAVGYFPRHLSGILNSMHDLLNRPGRKADLHGWRV